MSTSAFCAVGDMAAVNADLEAAGFGPGNFGCRQAYDGSARASHGFCHAWAGVMNNAGTQSFLDALNADARVTFEENEDIALTPRDRVKKLLDANSLVWPDQAPFLPEGGVTKPGEYYRYLRDAELLVEFWVVIQQHNRNTFGGDPRQYPALIREARIPGTIRPWVQPIDQFDAYLTIDPFTGEGERVAHNGSTWLCTDGSAGGPNGSLINTWEPGVFGWTNEGAV